VPDTKTYDSYVDAMSQVNEATQTTKVLADAINRGPGGREVALAITKLEEAFMWLDRAGKALDADARR